MGKFVKFKTRKVWNETGHTHFLTFCTDQRKPYLANDAVCELLAASILRAQEIHNFAVLAYVFMPDHVHLAVYPLNEAYDISAILKSIKLSSSKKVKNAGYIRNVLWESGGGYDRNVSQVKTRREVIRYILENPVRKGLVEQSVEYRWSSARWYLLGEEVDIPCHFRDELTC